MPTGDPICSVCGRYAAHHNMDACLRQVVSRHFDFPLNIDTQTTIPITTPLMNDKWISLDLAKKVITKDHSGKENGFLVELAKDGNLTTVYLSACAPGSFKGFHLHKVRTANYVCIRGKVKVITYTNGVRQETILDSALPERMNIPTMVPTGLSNEWEEEAWIVNTPDPAYDPELKDEQIEYTQEQLDCLFRQSPIKSAWQAGF